MPSPSSPSTATPASCWIPTHCPWYPLYPLLAFYLTGTEAADLETAKQCLYSMDRESHILLTAQNQHQLDALLPFTHQLILDDLSLWEPCGTQAAAQGIPCTLNLTLDQPYEPLPQGITGLRLRLTDPTDLDELDAALTTVETTWADAFPQLIRLHLGGPFPSSPSGVRPGAADRPDPDLPHPPSSHTGTDRR